MAGILFEDIFDVKDIDPDGKKFDRGEMIFSVCVVYVCVFVCVCVCIHTHTHTHTKYSNN